MDPDPGAGVRAASPSSPADEAVIAKVAAALRSNGSDVRVVDTSEEAGRLVLELVPLGAEVNSGKSKTLQDIGVFAELFESGKYESIRARYLQMDRKTQMREIRKLVSAPDYMLGSVNAITEAGDMVLASATASQLAAYAYGAGRLILVVGTQKIVPDLESALARIDRVVFPWEDAAVRERLNMGTFIGKLLIIRREWVEGRSTVILVREPVGV